MPIIYLIETNNHTALSQSIRFFSRYPYNHLSISLDPSLSEVYSFGRREPLNPLMAGFAKEDFSHPFYKDSVGRVYALQANFQEYEIIENQLHSFSLNPLAWHYNLLGLLPAYFQYSWDRSDHFFCSEFVATLLKSAGILSPLTRPSLMHPKDVIEAVHPSCIYDGRLQQYPELIKMAPHTSPVNRNWRDFNPIQYVYKQVGR